MTQPEAPQPEIWLVACNAGADTATIYTDLQHRPMTFLRGEDAQRVAEEIGPGWCALMLRRPQ